MLLVMASGMPFLAFSLGSAWATFLTNKQNAEAQALASARSLAWAVEGEVRSRIAILGVLSRSRALAAGDLVTFRSQAEAAVEWQVPGSNILLLRPDGQQLMNTALPPDAPLPARQYLENHRRVLATGRAAASDVFTGVVLRRAVVAIDVPVRGPGGEITHILSMNPTLDAFDELIRRTRPDPGRFISILDRTGRRVARVPSAPDLIGQPATPYFLQASAGRSEGTMQATAPEGQVLLVAYSRLPETGWTVAVGIPIAELTGPAWRSALTSLAVGLGLLALGLILARRLARSVTEPIAALQRIAAAPDAGGAAAGPTGLPEADEVANALRAETRRRNAAMGSLIDSERRLRLVVAELNHRAKNALFTVQSLAMQTARGGAGRDPERFLSDFTARLQSLARAHDLLVAFHWEPAALDAVLRAGLVPWLRDGQAGAQPPRIAIECDCIGPPPAVATGQAQALVLAMHELATNATKHGALSVPEGWVEVCCRGADGGHGVAVIWREHGGPPVPSPPARRGFGSRLLEQGLAHDLGPGASVTLDFNPNGVQATIRFTPRTHQAVDPEAGSPKQSAL